jgi:hypothetical protein
VQFKIWLRRSLRLVLVLATVGACTIDDTRDAEDNPLIIGNVSLRYVRNGRETLFVESDSVAGQPRFGITVYLDERTRVSARSGQPLGLADLQIGSRISVFLPRGGIVLLSLPPQAMARAIIVQ